MNERWGLQATNSVNQMLRIRGDRKLEEVIEQFPNLVIVKHQYHIADDIMFPDPACLAFFTAFEENHLIGFEEANELMLFAVDIFEGAMKYFIYAKDAQKAVYDSISFLKSNNNFKCEFEIVLNEQGSRLKNLI